MWGCNYKLAGRRLSLPPPADVQIRRRPTLLPPYQLLQLTLYTPVSLAFTPYLDGFVAGDVRAVLSVQRTSRSSSVGIMMLDFPKRVSWLAVGPTQPTVWSLPVAQRLGREGDHSFVEVIVWSHTSISPYASIGDWSHHELYLFTAQNEVYFII